MNKDMYKYRVSKQICLMALQGCMLFAGLTPGNARAQSSRQRDEQMLRSVADQVILHTDYQFVTTTDKKSGYASLREMGNRASIVVKNKYNKWDYVNGVIATGMLALGNQLRDKGYRDYVKRNYEFVFDNQASAQKDGTPGTGIIGWEAYSRMGSLDDCGALAAGLAGLYPEVPRNDFRLYLEKAGDYILHRQSRLKDGTLCRPAPRKMTIWADDLYMSVPFLARMAKLTGKKEYLKDAINQVEHFNKYLYNPGTGLYFHCWYSDIEMNGVAHWLRCNGWIAMAQTELISQMDDDTPQKRLLIRMLQRQITGLSRYQDATGLWHQIIDKPDSYLETSGSAMFIYAIARAVNEGWIDPSYLTIARKAWQALVNKIDTQGRIADVCVGTNIADDLNFYYSRPVILNDPHAIGAVLLAGAEMLKADER